MISVGGISAPQPLRPNLERKPPSVEEASSRGETLTEEEKQVVAQLKARDREVRAHEQAHKAVGGRYAGAISYDFDQGPDGKQYAVGGEVPIDVSPVSDNPKATIAKMEVVIAAALAPAEPSAQDRAVANLAKSQLQAAQAELRAEQRETTYNLAAIDPADPTERNDGLSLVA